MDTDEELEEFLSHVKDPHQREKALELWSRIKEKLSKSQRVAFLQAWNTYLVQSDISAFDQIIDEVLEELDTAEHSIEER